MATVVTAIGAITGLGTAGLTFLGVPITTAAGAATIWGTLGNLALSAVLSAATAPRAGDARQQLSFPRALPIKRTVYGETRAAGTPVPLRNPGGKKYLYVAWLVSSRPSVGPFDVLLDNRLAVLSGDPYDFTAGGGALVTNDPFDGLARVWIGRGDQDGPPAEILTDAPWHAMDAPDLFKATDAAKGCTVVWAKIDRGSSSRRARRWPNSPPLLEIEGQFTPVWDPRDPAQDANDPATWVYSDNHALCVLDALRTNPIRPFRLSALNVPEFVAAANASDQLVPLKAGGSERRYTLHGTLVYDGTEVEDMLEPMLRAGAAEFVRTGGQIGIRAGAYAAPVYTLSDVMDRLTMSTMAPADNMPTEIRATFVSRAREYQPAELPPWVIPGAQSDDGGIATIKPLALDWAGSATQAQRVARILGYRDRAQKTLAGIAPPDAIQLTAGAGVSVALPAPFDVLNGTFVATMVHPSFDPLGDGGVALRVPLALREERAEWYQWNAATDEADITEIVYNDDTTGVPMPGAISITTGAEVDLNTGGTVIQRIRFEFDAPSGFDADDIDEYEVQISTGSGPFAAATPVATATALPSGKLFGFIVAEPLEVYAVRVRTVTPFGVSDWRTLGGISIAFAIADPAATAGAGAATFTGTTPAPNGTGVRVYRAEVGAGFGAAAPVSAVLPVTAGAAFSVTAGAPAVNLFADPGFEDPAAWNAFAGWAVTGGVAQKTAGTAGNLQQIISGLTSSADYRWAVTISGRTDGTLQLRIHGATVASTASISANTLHFGQIAAPVDPADVRFFGNSTFNGAIDDALIYLPGADALPQGAGDFWIVPVTTTGVEGAPAGPYTLTII